MAYNSSAEAIKKLRSKKMGMDTFFEPEELQAGVEDQPLQERQGKETGLAPTTQEGLALRDDDDMEEQMVPTPNRDMEMQMQQSGLDQGDSVIPKGMYEPGDEKKKGFMGAAARKMMEAMKRG